MVSVLIRDWIQISINKNRPTATYVTQERNNKKNLLIIGQQVLFDLRDQGSIITFIAFSFPAFPNTS